MHSVEVIIIFPPGGVWKCESASCKVKSIHIYGSGKLLHLPSVEMHKWMTAAERSEGDGEKSKATE